MRSWTAFGLGKVEAAGEEGALGELAGVGEAGAGGEGAVEDGVEHNGGAVGGDLGEVLACVAVGGEEGGNEGFVENGAGFVEDVAEAGVGVG